MPRCIPWFLPLILLMGVAAAFAPSTRLVRRGFTSGQCSWPPLKMVRKSEKNRQASSKYFLTNRSHCNCFVRFQEKTVRMEVTLDAATVGLVSVLAFGGGGLALLFNVVNAKLDSVQINLKEVQTNLKNDSKEAKNDLKEAQTKSEAHFNAKLDSVQINLKNDLKEVQTNLKEVQTKSEAHFNTIISSQKKVARKIRKAFEDDDD